MGTFEAADLWLISLATVVVVSIFLMKVFLFQGQGGPENRTGTNLLVLPPPKKGFMGVN